MQNFADFNLPPFLKASLDRLGFVKPTPIQVQAIPIALEGQDILGSAQTGTGKTAAFLIPVITRLLASNDETALILTPTRELAKQVFDFANQLLGNRAGGIKAALLIGGAPIYNQLRQINTGARLLIGTPGRVNDHLSRNGCMLENARFLVLDETDLMLDMGFNEQIDDILEYMPQKRQTLLFSATLPPSIIKLSEKYMSNPQRISAGQANTVAVNIVEDIVYTTRDGKYIELCRALDEKQGAVLVFVKTKIDAELIAKKLQKNMHEVDVLHGGLRQSRRERVTKLFRNKKFRIMVATDVAARGLDIPHIAHVINYDMPQCHEDYIHRIGRTARAEASGHALSLITSGPKVNSIKEFFDAGRGKPMRGGGRSSSSRGGSSRGGFGGSSRPRYGAPRDGERSGGFGRSSDSREGGFNSERPARSSDRPARSFDRSERPARSESGFSSDRPRTGGFGRSSERSGAPREGGFSSERPANSAHRGSRAGGSRRPGSSNGSNSRFGGDDRHSGNTGGGRSRGFGSRND